MLFQGVVYAQGFYGGFNVRPKNADPGQAIEASVKVQGSTTFNSEILVLHRAAIEKSTGRPLDVVANKSSWGLLALVDKRVDIAMISAPLSSEIAAARKLRPDASFNQLLEFRVASTRVAFVVHPRGELHEYDRTADRWIRE